MLGGKKGEANHYCVVDLVLKCAALKPCLRVGRFMLLVMYGRIIYSSVFAMAVLLVGMRGGVKDLC